MLKRKTFYVVVAAIVIFAGAMAYIGTQSSSNSVTVNVLSATTTPAPIQNKLAKNTSLDKSFSGRFLNQVASDNSNQPGFRYTVGIYADAISARYSRAAPESTVIVNSTTTPKIGSAYLFQTAYNNQYHWFDVSSMVFFWTSGSDQ
jgi:hypothetical protein